MEVVLAVVRQYTALGPLIHPNMDINLVHKLLRRMYGHYGSSTATSFATTDAELVSALLESWGESALGFQPDNSFLTPNLQRTAEQAVQDEQVQSDWIQSVLDQNERQATRITELEDQVRHLKIEVDHEQRAWSSFMNESIDTND